MTTYLVECYWPGVGELHLNDAVERLTDPAPDQDDGVAWLSSILIPEDEIVLCLATGPSAEVVYASAQRAGLPAERVAACIHIAPEASTTPRGDKQ
jgi:hypothetical protein